MTTRSHRDAPSAVLNFVLFPLAAVLSAAFFLPVVWMLVASVRPEDEIFRNLGLFQFDTWVPSSVSLASYVDVLQGSFGKGLVNSLIAAGLAMAVGLPVSAAAAFALSASRFRGQGLILSVVVISFMVPFDAIAVPLFHYFREWDLQNTFVGLFLPAAGNGLAIFLLRQFFLGIPRELSEAMRVDGASWGTILVRLYLPLSRSALSGAAILIFMFQWNAYLWPILIAPSRDRQIAPVALAGELGQFEQFFGPLFAGTLILSAFPAVLMLLSQRTLQRSLGSRATLRSTTDGRGADLNSRQGTTDARSVHRD